MISIRSAKISKRTEALVKVCSFSAQEIIAKIKDAGIVGMGGATFPTHVKLSVPPGKKAECVIINGVECEPYLTSDHRTMLEHGEELVVGVTILMKAVGVGKAYIGIENNKPDAIAHLTKIAAGYKGIIVTLDTWVPGWRPRDLSTSNFPQLRGKCLSNYTSDPVFRAGLAQPPEENPQATLDHLLPFLARTARR